VARLLLGSSSAGDATESKVEHASTGHVKPIRGCAVAAYPSTVYRLDASGEVYEVIVEESAAFEVDEAHVAATQPQTDRASERDTFDETAWWSRQLGRRLSAA
jgi:hypothetical protein